MELLDDRIIIMIIETKKGEKRVRRGRKTEKKKIDHGVI